MADDIILQPIGYVALAGGRIARAGEAADVVYRDRRILGMIDWAPAKRKLHEVPDWSPR